MKVVELGSREIDVVQRGAQDTPSLQGILDSLGLKRTVLSLLETSDVLNLEQVSRCIEQSLKRGIQLGPDLVAYQPFGVACYQEKYHTQSLEKQCQDSCRRMQIREKKVRQDWSELTAGVKLFQKIVGSWLEKKDAKTALTIRVGVVVDPYTLKQRVGQVAKTCLLLNETLGPASFRKNALTNDEQTAVSSEKIEGIVGENLSLFNQPFAEIFPQGWHE